RREGGGMAKIFEREWLTAAQLRMVAERRFGDADYLRKSGENARANGVFYLGGFVLECLLKARMLETYPLMKGRRSPEGLSESDRALWFLIYRSHELETILGYLPGIERKLQAIDTLLRRRLAAICAEWTVFARYS